jgi:hypothetical protein
VGIYRIKKATPILERHYHLRVVLPG